MIFQIPENKSVAVDTEFLDQIIDSSVLGLEKQNRPIRSMVSKFYFWDYRVT